MKTTAPPSPVEIALNTVGLHLGRGEYVLAKAAIDRLERSDAEAKAPVTLKSIDEPLTVLGLPTRTTNALERLGIFTVRNLLDTERETILAIENVGPVTLEQILGAVERIGFRPEAMVT